MYSEINPPPPLPCMSATKYHDSWYYTERKIALLDARCDRQQGGTTPLAISSDLCNTTYMIKQHTNDTMTDEQLADQFASLTVHWDNYFDGLHKEDIHDDLYGDDYADAILADM